MKISFKVSAKKWFELDAERLNQAKETDFCIIDIDTETKEATCTLCPADENPANFPAEHEDYDGAIAALQDPSMYVEGYTELLEREIEFIRDEYGTTLCILRNDNDKERYCQYIDTDMKNEIFSQDVEESQKYFDNPDFQLLHSILFENDFSLQLENWNDEDVRNYVEIRVN